MTQLYAIRDTKDHGFKKNEIVRISKHMGKDTYICINDETGKYWAVKKHQLVPYKPISEGKVSAQEKNVVLIRTNGWK